MDREDEFLTGPDQRHLGFPGHGMLDDIPQGFLCNSVDAERHVVWPGPGDTDRTKGHRDILSSRHARTLGAQGVDKPQVVQD